jgi:fermentation-respiration switch protein FrsA (DUF1100 family)
MLKRLLMNIILGGFLLLGGLWLYARHLEKDAVFFPDRYLALTPAEAGLRFEEVWMKTSDGLKIHGWYLPGKAGAGVLLFAHGNAGNISGRVGKLELFNRLGLNVLIFDYRGYGRSEGRPTVEGIERDTVAAYEFLVKDKAFDPRRVIAYGSSLGGVPVLALAARCPVGAVIADSVFSSAADMAREIYPFIPSFMVGVRMDNLTPVSRITAPKLFIHSVNDEVVPYHLGRKVFDAAVGPKVFLDLQGSHVNGHMDDGPAYREGLVGFLDRYQFLEARQDDE